MNLLKYTIRFLRHQIDASSNHSIHSPKVYHFNNTLFRSHKYYQPFNSLKQLDSHWQADQSEIEIVDLGAGSRTNSAKKRRVSDIHKNSGKPIKIREFLFKLVDELHPETIVELGTSLGVTSAYLALARPAATVITLEGCKNTLNKAKEGFDLIGVKNVVPKLGGFDAQFPEVMRSVERIDLLFIDGNHTEEATLRYFEMSLEKVHAGSVIVFDDIYWSKGMMRAWEKIKAHPKVSLSLDFFLIGLVFFEERKHTEHYRLRVPLKTVLS